MALEKPPEAREESADGLPVYGNHKFTAQEIANWRLVAEQADAFWLERGSDNSLDAEFKERFGVTFFEHAYLLSVAICERWTAKGSREKENS